MEITFNVDIKTLRKAFVLVDEYLPSDEEIAEKLKGRVIDISGAKDEDTQSIELAVCLTAMGKVFENA